MFVERKWLSVAPRPLTANGTALGVVTVASVRGLYTKQKIALRGTALPVLGLEIKRILSDTRFEVGAPGPISNRTDVSAYTTAANSEVVAPEQDRPNIPPADYGRAVYAEEPIVAKRSILVDYEGDYYDSLNPLPVMPVTSEAAEILALQIINTNLTIADTTYTVSLPSDIRRFMLKIRDGKGPLKIFDGLNYFTVSRGSFFDSGNINNPSMVLSVQSGQASSVLEVQCWVVS